MYIYFYVWLKFREIHLNTSNKILTIKIYFEYKKYIFIFKTKIYF